MSDWIDHDGKGPPLRGDTLVAVKFGDGFSDEEHKTHETIDYWADEDLDACAWTWLGQSDRTPDCNIVAYKEIDK